MSRQQQHKNQLFWSRVGGARCLTIDKVNFGWDEIVTCLKRDQAREVRDTKLHDANVELDGYSLMCVTYAKAPSERETLLEQHSQAGIKMFSKQAKPSYDSNNIPDMDSPSKDVLKRKDALWDSVHSNFLIQIRDAERSTFDLKVSELFMSANKDHVSCGFIGLLTKMEKQALPQLEKGFAAFLLADHNFRETMKVATFTENKSWYRAFCSLSEDDGKALNQACVVVMCVLVGCLSDSSKRKKSDVCS